MRSKLVHLVCMPVHGSVHVDRGAPSFAVKVNKWCSVSGYSASVSGYSASVSGYSASVSGYSASVSGYSASVSGSDSKSANGR